MLAIGLNFGHDAGAACVRDREAVTLVEAERVTGQRHVCAGTPAGLHAVLAAAETMLDGAQAAIGVVDYLPSTVTSLSENLATTVHSDAWAPHPRPHRSVMQRALSPAPLYLAHELGCSDFVLIRHHWAHACLAYAMSDDTEPLVLVLDGTANFGECGLLARGINGVLQPVASFFNRSGPRFGALYECASAAVFGSQFHTGKLLGLAAYGRAHPIWTQVFRALIAAPRVRAANQELFAPLDAALLSQCEVSSDGVHWARPWEPPENERPSPARFCEAVFGIPFPRYLKWRGGFASRLERPDVAASVQQAFETDLLDFVSGLVAAYPGVRTLCFAGGCALNISANTRLAQGIAPVRLTIPSCCDDSGVALGAALAVSAERFGRSATLSTSAVAFAGPELADVLPAPYFPGADPRPVVDEVAARLADGAVVGWVNGRMETGPRALGHRSILANPFIPGMRHLVSEAIKQREWFRPLGMICREEDASQYFDGPSFATPTMLFAWRVLPSFAAGFEHILHCDGSMRLQTVSKEESPHLYDLIGCFAARGFLPFLINTSLNPKDHAIMNRFSDILAFASAAGLDCVAHVDASELYQFDAARSRLHARAL